MKKVIEGVFKSAKELKVGPAVDKKLNLKEAFAKIKEGKTIDQVVEPLPKTEQMTVLPGEKRFDDQISITSDFKYPAGLLQIVGADKDLVASFNEMDSELASFDSDIKKQIDEKILKGLQFKGEAPEINWDHMMRIAPSFVKPQIEQMKNVQQNLNKIPENFEQLLLSYEAEYEEMFDVLEKDDQYIDERIQFFDEELQRTKDFYEKLPTLTVHEFCEMEPELYEMAIDELERKVNTVGWDPVIEPTQSQLDNEEHLKRVLGLRSLPEIPA